MFDEAIVKNPWVRAGVVVAAIVLVAIAIYLLAPVLFPLLIAFVVAYLLNPVVDFFERRKVPRSRAIALLASLAIVLAIALPITFVPMIVTEAEALVRASEDGIQGSDRITSWIRSNARKLPLDELAIRADCDVVSENADDDELDVLIRCLALNVREWALDLLETHADQLFSFGRVTGQGLLSILRTVGDSIITFILFLAKFALFSFVAGYLLKDYHRIVAAEKDLIPVRYRARVTDMMRRIDHQIRELLRGQALVCLCLGIMYMVGLSIAGVPFAILLGAFGAIASFVPYLGITLTILPSIILCLIQHNGFDWHFIAVILTFVVAQMLEGTVLTPKIVGDRVGLNPVWVILAILVFGNWLGFVGLLIAVPVAASLKVLVVDGIAYYRASPLFRGSFPSD